MVPGVMLSGVNVGGSASGQQLTPTVRGGGSGNNMWNMEGASTTDMAATGASAVYYDFDSFQEIQVTTGGSDASIQTSGLNINLISKSGSNVFKGTFSGAYEDDNMQWRNVTRDMFYGGGTLTTPLTGTPMIKNYEYGGDAGGPIIRNRLWYWGAARKNLINNTVVGFFKTTPECTPVPNTFEQIKETVRCMHPDWTELVNYNTKFNYQLNAANRFQFLMQFADKIRNARDASTTRSPETAYAQSAWYDYGTPTYNFKHTWVLTDKLVFDNGFNHTGAASSWTSRIPSAVDPPAVLRRRHQRLDALLSAQRPGPAAEHRDQDRQQLLLVESARRRPPGQVRRPLQDVEDRRRRPLGRQCDRAVRRPRRRIGHRLQRDADDQLLRQQPRPGARALLPGCQHAQQVMDLRRLHPGQLQPWQAAVEHRRPLRLPGRQDARHLCAGLVVRSGTVAGVLLGRL